MMRKFISLLLNIKGDFQNLFIFNEYNELIGKSKRGIITLAAILTITFLALGYSIGGINYLKVKMEDPFTNWVNLDIKNSYREQVSKIQMALESDTMKNKFLLNNIGNYNIDFFSFIDVETKEKYNKKLRSIDLDDNLLTEILKESKGNVIHGYEYDEKSELSIDKCGIIVKESTLLELGYEDVSNVQKIPIKVGDFLIYPEVISVVKELPNLVDGIISSHFYSLMILPFEETNFINVASSNQLELLSAGKSNSEIEEDLRKHLKKYNLASVGHESLEIADNIEENITTVYFYDYYSPLKFDSIFNELTETSKVIYNRYTRWECNVGSEFGISDPYYMSFNFDKLDNVRDFKAYMQETFEVEISMDQIEQKENFALVSRLTNVISLILFGFSILSIVFYVNSLLTTHLEKIKMNLGTLKAFGLNNKFLVNSYLKIILTFIGISIVIGFLINAIWDILEKQVFEQSYFDVFNIKILAAIVIIILTALITSHRTISKTLSKTPGDLIYNR